MASIVITFGKKELIFYFPLVCGLYSVCLDTFAVPVGVSGRLCCRSSRTSSILQ